MRLSGVLFLFLSCATLIGQDKDKDVPGIRFPSGPVKKVDPPTPAKPAAIDNYKMFKDEVFVIDSDDELFIRMSPKVGTSLKVTAEEGPIKMRAQFVGGAKQGYLETRTFKGKHVYLIESMGKVDGKVDLFVIPKGVDKDSAVLTKTIDVMTGGVTPTPPPKPKPDPVDPKPKPPGPVTSFHVVMVYESGTTYTATQEGVLYSKDIRDYLTAKCTPDNGTLGWRMRDKDRDVPNETPFQKSLWDAVKPKITAVPCWAVEVNGKVDIIPLPASVAEGLSTLKTYAEGK